MKKRKFIISYDAEKLSAIEDYSGKKGVDLNAKITEAIAQVYDQCVPAPVREFIDSKQKKELEAKAKAAEKPLLSADTAPAPIEKNN